MVYGKAKGEHAFQTFHRDLREGNFPSVIFMYGEEEYLIEWACKSLAKKYVDAAAVDVDFVRWEQKESSGDLTEVCNTFSVFSERRVVWARELPALIKKNVRGWSERDTEKILEYMENPNPMCILVLSCCKPDSSGKLYKALKKKCRVYEFGRLDRSQLTAFAAKRFDAAKANADRAALRYLIEETGYFHRDTVYDLYNLENDIKKLAAYRGGEPIREEDIDAVLKGDMDKFAFDFLDAVTSGQKGKALRLLHNILGSGGEVYGVLGLLINQFELMLEAKELKAEKMNKDEIAQKLSMNSYRVGKALSFADKFSEEKLKDILTRFYEADRSIKTGVMEQTLALELIIGGM